MITVSGVWRARDDPRWGPPPVTGEFGDTGDPLEPGDVPHSDDPYGDDPYGEDERMADRFVALGRFTRAVAPYVTHLEAPGLDAAIELADRAGARLSLGGLGAARLGGHTVVALAGPTGAGKSSLFNALARMTLSPAGHLRPTTGQAYACVWEAGAPGGRHGSDPLLEWLGVDAGRRFLRESVLDAQTEAELRGLVLLDLPDLDSIDLANRLESDRLVGVVDRLVWVLDPQKYADAGVHDEYLRRLGALRDVTVVVFNQVDRLDLADARRCHDDLVRLLAADGLAGVPVIGVSTATGQGVAELRGLLASVVADRHAAMARLTAELGVAAGHLTLLTPVPAVPEEEVSRVAVPELAETFADACGADGLVAQATAAYRRVVLWRAPWHVDPGFPPIPAADPVAITAGVRRLAQHLAGGLPEPWPRHLRAAAQARLPSLPTDLADALRVGRGDSPAGPLWLVGRALWWAAGAVAVLGLAVSFVDPTWVVVFLGGLGVATIMAGVAVGTTQWRALRYRRAVASRLERVALASAREVVAPLRRILRDYTQAYGSLQETRATTLRSEGEPGERESADARGDGGDGGPGRHGGAGSGARLVGPVGAAVPAPLLRDLPGVRTPLDGRLPALQRALDHRPGRNLPDAGLPAARRRRPA